MVILKGGPYICGAFIQICSAYYANNRYEVIQMTSSTAGLSDHDFLLQIISLSIGQYYEHFVMAYDLIYSTHFFYLFMMR